LLVIGLRQDLYEQRYRHVETTKAAHVLSDEADYYLGELCEERAVCGSLELRNEAVIGDAHGDDSPWCSAEVGDPAPTPAEAFQSVTTRTRRRPKRK